MKVAFPLIPLDILVESDVSIFACNFYFKNNFSRHGKFFREPASCVFVL